MRSPLQRHGRGCQRRKRAPDGYSRFCGAVHQTLAESPYALIQYAKANPEVVKDAGARVDN